MDIRQNLYAALCERLKEVESVKHVDLWNHNVEFLDAEDAWPRPAVFVEFCQIAWQSMAGGKYRGEGEIRLHIVTDWNDGGQGTAWELCEDIRRAVDQMPGEQFGIVHLSTTETNHNHEDILESIDTYRVRYYMTIGK